MQLVTAIDDPERAAGWISAEQAAVGVEGCVAKPLTSRYPTRSGRAGWIKVRCRRRNSSYTVCQGPYRAGRSRHCTPCVPETGSHRSAAVSGAPTLSLGGNGSSFAHCSFVKSPRPHEDHFKPGFGSADLVALGLFQK
jgi:hypothetical protein